MIANGEARPEGGKRTVMTTSIRTGTGSGDERLPIVRATDTQGQSLQTDADDPSSKNVIGRTKTSGLETCEYRFLKRKWAEMRLEWANNPLREVVP